MISSAFKYFSKYTYDRKKYNNWDDNDEEQEEEDEEDNYNEEE
jgi:hypothetical protein